jgi:hypothetical protein
MKIKRLDQFSNVFAYLRYKFPRQIEQLADLPVVELSREEFDENKLTGEGYLYTATNLQGTHDNIAGRSPQQLSMLIEMDPFARRDLYLYSIYKKIKQVPFVVVLDEMEAASIHEAAHLVWELFGDEDRSKIELPEVPEGDEYLQSPQERFTLTTEMGYYKMQGTSFDDYFKQTRPVEYALLSNPQEDVKRRELALMDYRDYKVLWDGVKTAGSDTNWLVRVATGSHTSG